MLAQLRAATALGEALGVVFSEGRVRHHGPGSLRPTLTVDLTVVPALMQAWLAWNEIAPRGDDWHPAYVPPSEIRVPPLEDEAPPADGS